jgi:hypothetical protein
MDEGINNEEESKDDNIVDVGGKQDREGPVSGSRAG